MAEFPQSKFVTYSTQKANY